MNNDIKIMLKILAAAFCIFLVLMYPKTFIMILAFIFARAFYIQRTDIDGFLRKIKYTFKLRL